MLQKFIGALLHRWWIRRREVELWNETNSIAGEYLKPGWLDNLSFTFFCVKNSFFNVIIQTPCDKRSLSFLTR